MGKNNLYHLPRGKVSHRFLALLTDEWIGARARKWNLERPLCLPTCLPTCILTVWCMGAVQPPPFRTLLINIVFVWMLKMELSVGPDCQECPMFPCLTGRLFVLVLCVPRFFLLVCGGGGSPPSWVCRWSFSFWICVPKYPVHEISGGQRAAVLVWLFSILLGKESWSISVRGGTEVLAWAALAGFRINTLLYSRGQRYLGGFVGVGHWRRTSFSLRLTPGCLMLVSLPNWLWSTPKPFVPAVLPIYSVSSKYVPIHAEHCSPFEALRARAAGCGKSCSLPFRCQFGGHHAPSNFMSCWHWLSGKGG